MDYAQTPVVLVGSRLRRIAWTIAGLVALVLGIHINQYEGGALDILFTVAVVCATGMSVALATRRPLFALVFTTALVMMIFMVSKAKQESMNMVLHAYDIIFYFSSWSTVTFMIESYRSHVVGLAVGATAFVAVSVLAFRIDRPSLARRTSAIAAAAFAVVAFSAAYARGDRHDASFFFDDRYVSSFFSSLSETLAVIWRGNLVEASTRAPGPNFKTGLACQPDNPPNIILIHQESTVPPSFFPRLSYDPVIDPFFRSHDGKLHELRVETFAGASWLTEFSVLTGLSSHSFGGMRPFVQTVMAGKLHDTLPQVLAGCGYHNLLVYPMLRNFVSNARFYDKVGIHQIIDAEDQKAKRPNERDRFYYANALAEMERRVEQFPPQPMFVYIQTQATHGSYDFTYMPEVNVPGGGPGTHAEVHEYLRRIGMAAMDYGYLKAELARRFPGRPFLIVNYGDHQPDITRGLLGAAKYSGVLSIDRHPAAFASYYSVDAVGYQPPALPGLAQVDVPYLGTILLESARLPLPDSYKERKRLMWLCNGRYHGCLHKADILIFHRRLMNSGLMDAM